MSIRTRLRVAERKLRHHATRVRLDRSHLKFIVREHGVPREQRRDGLSELARCHTASDYVTFASRWIAPPSHRDREITGLIEHMRAREPRLVVEIGTEHGGTSFVLANALPTVVHLVMVDLAVFNRRRIQAFSPTTRITAIEGDSHSPAVVDRVADALGGQPIDLLIIDGDHSYLGAATDFRLYRRFVRPSGVIVFHDIVPDDMMRHGESASDAYAGEVPLLWDQLRRQYRTSELVESWQQEGCGIGLLEHDASVDPSLGPPARSA